MGIIWTIIIGFIAGVIAKFIMPGSSNEPSGFILTTILGIVGAFVASYLGQALGWYAPGEGAGLIGAVVGAIVVLFVWGLIAKRTAKVTPSVTVIRLQKWDIEENEMSRGMPSMVALLGLLAVAGYQNRDKIADLPAAVDKFTPEGRLPTEAEAARLV